MKDLVAATPPVALTSMSLLGFPITDWAALVSIVWVLILMLLKFKELRAKKKGCVCSD